MEGKSWIQKWGTRHTFITLSFFLMIMNQCWRINLSVAIVAMVNHGKYTKILLIAKLITPNSIDIKCEKKNPQAHFVSNYVHPNF